MPAPAVCRFVVARIISGGQTGVDRAALDVALEIGLGCGGWCPRGRRAEDGAIPARYPLRETRSPGYPERTAANVRDADATLVLTRGEPQGGTALTVSLARRLRKPCIIVDLAAEPCAAEVRQWLVDHNARLLNVAGPRQSEQPGIHDQVAEFLRRVMLGDAREK